MLCTFKEIEQKSFVVKEDYNKIHELFDQHSASLNDAKNEYETLKKTVDQLRSSEVDADYNLQDIKKTYKDLELKGKGYKKKLDDLLIALSKHIAQIQKDSMDPEKLQTTLRDGTLGETCDLNRAL